MQRHCQIAGLGRISSRLTMCTFLEVFVQIKYIENNFLSSDCAVPTAFPKRWWHLSPLLYSSLVCLDLQINNELPICFRMPPTHSTMCLREQSVNRLPTFLLIWETRVQVGEHLRQGVLCIPHHLIYIYFYPFLICLLFSPQKGMWNIKNMTRTCVEEKWWVSFSTASGHHGVCRAHCNQATTESADSADQWEGQEDQATRD